MLHAAALLLALVLLALLAGPRTSISSDEGAAIHQAVLLQRGGWLVEPTLPELDPGLVQQPFLLADAGEKGRAPYAKHPAYPLLLERAIGAWGRQGLVVPGVLGVWAAAVAAALLAGALRATATIPTLWLLGLGSPLTVDAQLVLAHAPAAGTAAVAALAAGLVLAPAAFGRLGARGWVPPAATAVAMLAAAATVALRTEGALLVGGLVVGAVLSGSAWRRSIGLAAGLLAAAVGARAVEVAVVRSVVGAAAPAPAPPSSSNGFLAARAQAFQTSWLDVGHAARPGAALLGMAALALLGAVVGSRWQARTGVVTGLIGLALGSASGWLLLGDVGMVPGLLPATPWLVAGVASTRRSGLRPGLSRFLAVASVASAGAILATQYSFGGGVEWGGRFYAVVLPLASPVAVAALWPDSPGWWRTPVAPPVMAAVGLTALVSVGGLLAIRSGHDSAASVGRELARAAAASPPGRPGDPDHRAVVVGPQRLWPQLLWPHLDEHRWVTAERDHLPCTLFGLREAGFDSLVLLGPRVDDLVSLAEPQGWRAAPGPPGRFTRLVQARVPAPATTPACPPDLGR
ncbi:MAG: hypothetical protein AVDCRST_MAG76-1249 [uncultured Acidimicrobiales bacterium]|uniref:Glycosyltransferase RgtA/B/C/D-like domain-containing protein n=1 Tax=uncultured Acidimicrobiales bacterium TaxID=310071 RepID=A0A6J4HRQ7_9ACTN|nr:MAG: hypothetical protein AVDCRST_MAG76-1249 [uncultured Acidimicrobiales bacterium]